jgi:hypothetical protein
MAVNSLFNITDIKYKKDDLRDSFDPLNTGSSRGIYRDNLRYPIDLGTSDKGHYVYFTIFEQEDTNFRGSEDVGGSIGQGDIQRIMETGGTVTGQGIQQVAQGVEQIRGFAETQISQLGQSFSSMTSLIDEIKSTKTGIAIEGFTKGVQEGTTNEINRISSITGQNFLRRIRKISETIALYMPDTLAFNYDQSYSDVQMYGGKLGMAAVGASALSELAKGNVDPKRLGELVGMNMSPFLSNALGKKLGTPGSAIAAAAFGGVQNPQLELLYTSPSFRNFQFDFMFYPTSEKEASEVYQIINSFKFHQAPEIKSGSAGFFLIPPSMFNIEFLYNGNINPNLPKISDCVLTGISVDYAPNGWAAYEVPSKLYAEQGGTGTPVGTRLTLSFKETIIHTKATHTKGSTNQRVNR